MSNHSMICKRILARLLFFDPIHVSGWAGVLPLNIIAIYTATLLQFSFIHVVICFIFYIVFEGIYVGFLQITIHKTVFYVCC